MKKRTIERVLEKKFYDFMSSITDEKTRELVRENSLITGGCIASMLLKEQVHDYDIYFTDKETVLAVANYYASKFQKSNADVIDVDSMTDPVQIEYYRLHGISGAGRVAIYCSATYQNTESFEADEEDIENLTSVILNEKDNSEEGEKYRPLFLSPNAISLSHKVQLILRFYGTPEEIHKNYDFVHVTNYWIPKKGLTLNQPALESILAKELIYVGSKYPVASILRCRKFILRGWTINAGQQLKIMYQVSKLNLDDIAILEDQLVGVDVAYFVMLISALRATTKKKIEEGIPFSISYEYLAEIIDRIFNR
jgi:hypothetical protein